MACEFLLTKSKQNLSTLIKSYLQCSIEFFWIEMKPLTRCTFLCLPVIFYPTRPTKLWFCRADVLYFVIICHQLLMKKIEWNKIRKETKINYQIWIISTFSLYFENIFFCFCNIVINFFHALTFTVVFHFVTNNSKLLLFMCELSRCWPQSFWRTFTHCLSFLYVKKLIQHKSNKFH